MAKTINKPSPRHRRILVLGSTNHTKLVTAYAWNNLPANLNVSDFDTIILNFTPFQDKDFAKGINIDLIPNWQQFSRHLISDESEIIVIGSANFAMGRNPFMPSTWWLPVELNFVYEPGVDIRNIDSSFAFYFDFVHSWSFHLANLREKFADFTRQYLQVIAPTADMISPVITNLAETRFSSPIGFRLQFQFFEKVHDYSDNHKLIKDSGFVYWLPAPTEIDTAEAIDYILRQRYAIQFEKIPPEWIGKFQLPSQLPILAEIQEKESRISELEMQLVMERQKLIKASQFLKLLYEQGEDVLEPVVRDALRELGASVEDPKVKGREDGRLVDSFAHNFTLEVKGRSGELKLSDVRELDQWVRDAIANENWHSKGLLIANLQLEQEPRTRKNILPPNCITTAKNFDISLLST